jgi:hypothetical protein
VKRRKAPSAEENILLAKKKEKIPLGREKNENAPL